MDEAVETLKRLMHYLERKSAMKDADAIRSLLTDNERLLVEVEQPGNNRPITLAGPPIKLTGTPSTIYRRPPKVGEHSEEILAEAVPIHDDAREHTPDAAAALAAALTDGEDYELLFSLPPDEAEKLCRAQPLPVEVNRIGQVVAGSGIALLHSDGRTEELKPCGWEHRT